VKALSLWQPWASLVALSVKTIETRHWETKYRGPLAIHAAKRRAQFADMKQVVGDQVDAWEAWYKAGYVSEDGETDDMPYGAVVATCELLYCAPVLMHCSSSVCVVPESDGLWLYNPGTGRGADIDKQRPFGDFTLGRYAWVLGNIKLVDPPVPATGHQGLWEWAA